MASLRTEVDVSNNANDELKVKIKELEHDQTAKEQEINSLSHRNNLLEQEVEKLEKSLGEAKTAAADGQGSQSMADNLQRKVTLLEEELEVSDTNLKKTTAELRQLDVNSDHFERQVQSLEKVQKGLEEELEEMKAKYEAAKKELEEIHSTLDTL